jgi:hypothetical protein
VNTECRTKLRRGINHAGWLIPAVLLPLLPKCPACLATYIAIAAGFGVSLTAAA